MGRSHIGQILDFSTSQLSSESIPAAGPTAPSTPSTDFLWVDSQDKQSDGQTLSGTKQTFLKTKHHQRRREARLQRLRGSIVSFPTQSSQPSEPNSPDLVSTHEPVLYRGLEAELKQHFPPLGVHSGVNLDLYFHYFISHTARACFPLNFESIGSWLWQKALIEPAFAPALLTLSATNRAANLSLAGAPQKMISDCARDLLRLRAQSMKSVRRFLKAPAGADYGTVILFVTQLLATEQQEANDQASKVHFKGLAQLVDAAGGLDNLEDYTLATIYCNDHLGALMRNSTPIFRMSPKWRERAFREILSLRDHLDFTRLPSLGSRLSNAPWSTSLPSAFQNLIESFKILVLSHEGITKNRRGPLMIKQNGVLLLTHQLLCLADECSGNPIDDTLRLSLLVYSAIRLWSFQGLACMNGASLGLQKTINAGYAVLLLEAPDLLLWALFMGSLASQNLDCHGWFLSNLMDIAEHLSLTNWDRARVVLGEVFFVYRSTDEPARVIWNSAIQSRASSIPSSYT